MAEYVERKVVITKIRAEGMLSGSYHSDREIEDNVVDILESVPAADVAPVVHGRRVKSKSHAWIKNRDGSIDLFAASSDYCNGPVCTICGEALCIHCNPNWEEDNENTCNEHDVCSKCGTPIDTDAVYCPSCGAKMQEARQMEWISVKERLPEPGVRVLLSGGPFVGEGFMMQYGSFSRYNGLSENLIPWLRKVTHWMPLPEPPKEDSEHDEL